MRFPSEPESRTSVCSPTILAIFQGSSASQWLFKRTVSLISVVRMRKMLESLQNLNNLKSLEMQLM